MSLSGAAVGWPIEDRVRELGALALLGALPARVLAALGERLFNERPESLVADLAQGRLSRLAADGWPGWERWRRADVDRVGAWCERHGLSVVLSPSAGRGLERRDGGSAELGARASEPGELASRVAPWLVLARQRMPEPPSPASRTLGPRGAVGGAGTPQQDEVADTDTLFVPDSGSVPDQTRTFRQTSTCDPASTPDPSGRARRPRVLPAERIPVVGIVSGRGATGYGREVAARLAQEAAIAGARVLAPLQGAGLPALQQASQVAGRAQAPAPWAVSADPLLGTRWSPARERLVERVLGLADGAVIGNRAVGLDVAGTGGQGDDPLEPTVWQAEVGRTVGIGADVLVVVEWDGAERCGPVGAAVDAALAAGAEVAAVPGSVFSGASAGCNRLIAEGATVIGELSELRAVLDRALAGRW